METRMGKIEAIPLPMGRVPRDLLQKVAGRDNLVHKIEKSSSSDEDELELSLGLSLNGRFGVDPRAKKLMRTCSIPDFINPVREEEKKNDVQMGFVPLMRTCSLPVETEEEWKRRKELQTLRRMEAKRKRNEKQRNLKMARERSRAGLEESCEEDKRSEVINGYNNSNSNANNSKNKNINIKQEQCLKNNAFGLSNWMFSAKSVEFKAENGHRFEQGSIGSQGSGSSGISESESQPGMNKCADARSPPSIQSQPEAEQKPPVASGAIPKPSGKFAGAVRNITFAPPSSNNGDKESIRNLLESMPFVSTKGDGPNGKRVEGFLYRYRKGEEVRILCVCHGNFLSPAEFVKHGGGGDVTHPLKHIVVNPSPLL